MALVLATVAQLRNRLQDQSLDAGIAQAAIDDATAVVKAVMGQDLEFVANDTVVLAGGDRDLTLPQGPVVVDAQHPLTVVELVDGTSGGGVPAVEGVAFRRVGTRLIRPGRTREGVRVTSAHGVSDIYPLGVWAPWVQVTYSHGHQTEATLPAGLSQVILSTAADLANNPTGLRSVALDGEVTLTWASESVTVPGSTEAAVRRSLRAIGARRGTAFSI